MWMVFVLKVVLSVISAYIPASPSGRYNPHINSSFNNTGREYIKKAGFEVVFPIPILIWVIFDFVIYLAMNVRRQFSSHIHNKVLAVFFVVVFLVILASQLT